MYDNTTEIAALMEIYEKAEREELCPRKLELLHEAIEYSGALIDDYPDDRNRLQYLMQAGFRSFLAYLREKKPAIDPDRFIDAMLLCVKFPKQARESIRQDISLKTYLKKLYLPRQYEAEPALKKFIDDMLA